MPLEVRCAGCGKLLRVADEHAGKALRCPVCNHISTAPSTASVSPAAPDLPGWHMRTPEGQSYGPVTRDELDRWAAQGRLSAECQLSQAAAGPWESAVVLFPNLRRSEPKPTPPPTFQPAAPFAPSSYQPMGQPASGFVNPHRGGLILVLALVGIIMGCPIFSLMAWVMGSSDLREIRAGRMDRSGEGLTQAGQLLGMIPSLLFILLAVGVMLVIVIAAVAS